MEVLTWAIYGLAVGIIPDLRRFGGTPMDIALGISGALLSGWLGLLMGFYERGKTAGLITAAVGAIIVVGIYRLLPPPLPRPKPARRLPLRPYKGKTPS